MSHYETHSHLRGDTSFDFFFDDISFKHIFRELNKEADGLSKEAAQLPQAQWLIEDLSENEAFGYYHRPYHEI